MNDTRGLVLVGAAALGMRLIRPYSCPYSAHVEEPMAEIVTPEAVLAEKNLSARRERTQKELRVAPNEFGNGTIDRAEYSRRVNAYIDVENKLETWRQRYMRPAQPKRI